MSSALFYTYLAANLLRLEVLQITEDLASLTTQLPFRTWYGRLNLVRQNLKVRLFFNYLLERRLNFSINLAIIFQYFWAVNLFDLWINVVLKPVEHMVENNFQKQLYSKSEELIL